MFPLIPPQGTNLPNASLGMVDPQHYLGNLHMIPTQQIPSAEAQLNDTLNRVCELLSSLTEEQRQTNNLLRKLINQDVPSGFKLVKLGSADKPYLRYLIVLDNERSRPRIDCPICNENVEVTTAKRGGCKQQSFCGDYVVCNECSNDALQKILRCPACCKTYSNISVPICEHLAAATETEGHLARKGSGSGCPLCSNKLVKDKCPQNCARKDLADFNIAKTILADKIFVLVKNPEACTDDNDRPCSHYCRCTKHNILFTNRNKGAKCRECTKESSKQRSSPAATTTQQPLTSTKRKRNSNTTPNTSKIKSNTSQPAAKRYCVSPPHPTDLQSDMPFEFLDQPLEQKQEIPIPEESYSYWPFPNISFPNVKELGRKVPTNFDELFERIPYSEGVVELGKRVGIIQEEDEL